MASISDVTAYLCEKYPHKSELSKTRLTKLVYLADWQAANDLGRQLTNIDWYFHNFGPYVDDVMNVVMSDPRFEVSKTTNFYGDMKLQIAVQSDDHAKLGEAEVAVLNKVIEETSPMYWNSFIKHVYQTKPILDSDRYSSLDLVKIASEGARVS
jgi:hypothetical protein